jgi:hypothetical protein
VAADEHDYIFALKVRRDGFPPATLWTCAHKSAWRILKRNIARLKVNHRSHNSPSLSDKRNFAFQGVEASFVVPLVEAHHQHRAHVAIRRVDPADEPAHELLHQLARLPRVAGVAKGQLELADEADGERGAQLELDGPREPSLESH